ncbi:MAG TPA: GTP cyclohydrolase FolE2 [Burkholderiaceae bacterium]|nr:GTP cyclohydrolase FolE2 [Burkholderiaceae bacterium]
MVNTRDSAFVVPTIVDVQASRDDRQLPIRAVGVRNVRYPLVVRTARGTQPTVAHFQMSVGLPAEQKGTHMSRFIALLEEQREPVGIVEFGEMLNRMLTKLEAVSGRLEARFAYFIEKTAPISGVKSLLDVEAIFGAEANGEGVTRELTVVVPVTSLCPCSKEISEYGAHNQRSHVTIKALLASAMTIEELVRVAENAASAELYGLLKRVDEKHVTEAAYDNPKFVEDLVRDVVSALRADPRIAKFEVEVENFESIHNHSAWARVDSDSLE